MEPAIQFVTGDGKEVMGGCTLPRHVKIGDLLTIGGSIEAPQRKYRVTAAAAQHHALESTGSRWISRYVVEEIK